MGREAQSALREVLEEIKIWAVLLLLKVQTIIPEELLRGGGPKKKGMKQIFTWILIKQRSLIPQQQ